MLTLKAPAKINWFLDILGMRDDGFHEIRSLIQKVTLYDTLAFSISHSGGVELRTDARVPVEDNLVYRAAMLLKNRHNVRDGAIIGLDKEIPMGAGLGGGSSDAAAALLGLNSLWSLDLSRDELCGIAGELGSDVPFFLYGPVSLAFGRGERIVPQNALKTVNILLVKPSFDISTAWAYKKFSEKMSLNTSELTKKPEKVNNIEHFIRSIERAELSDLVGNVSNDLESVTIESFPVIAEIKERLLNHGAAFSLMSGSGSVVFGVFDSPGKAEEAAGAFDGFWTAAVRTIVD